MDARDVYDELDDEYDEENIDVARDVAAIALTPVHGLNIMDLQSSQKGSMLPQTVPLPLFACKIVWLPCAAACHFRYRRTFPTKFVHSTSVLSAMSTTPMT
jgi:hypothetical protein